MSFTWKGHKLVLKKIGNYSNGHTAYGTFDANNGEPYHHVSVNLDPKSMKFIQDNKVIYVKNYSENFQIEETLIAAGYLEPTGMSAQSGFCNYHACRVLKDDGDKVQEAF